MYPTKRLHTQILDAIQFGISFNIVFLHRQQMASQKQMFGNTLSIH